jgi:rod shape-determining protein MreD
VSLSRWFWLLVAGFGIVVLQLTLADELTISGVHAELIWVLPVAVGLAAGTKAGMAAGLAGGAVADLFLPTPFGLTPLIGVLVGYVVGLLGEEGIGDLGGSAWWVAPSLGFAAGLVAPALYAGSGAALGHRGYLSTSLAVVCALDAVACALLVRPVMRILGRLVVDDTLRAGPLEPVRGAL